MDLLPASPTREARRESLVPATPSVPPPASQHSTPAGLPPSRAKPPTEGAGSPAKASQASKLRASKEEEEEDWLSHALSRKKSQGLAREQRAGASEGLSLAGTAGHPPSGRYGLGLLWLVGGGLAADLRSPFAPPPVAASVGSWGTRQGTVGTEAVSWLCYSAFWALQREPLAPGLAPGTHPRRRAVDIHALTAMGTGAN